MLSLRNLSSNLALRRSPRLLLAAAALAVLAGVLVHDAPSASARHKEDTVWEATMEVQTLSEYWRNYGCDQSRSTDCRDALSSRVFTYDGSPYRIISFGSYGRGNFQMTFWLGPDVSDLAPLILRVTTGESEDAREFYVYDAKLSVNHAHVTWANVPGVFQPDTTVTLTLFDPRGPQVLPSQDRLPMDYSVEPVPPSQRTPSYSGASSSDGYCYLGEGNGKTEYVRYPNGRLGEVPKQSEYIRSLYSCH